MNWIPVIRVDINSKISVSKLWVVNVDRYNKVKAAHLQNVLDADGMLGYKFLQICRVSL